MHTKDLRYLRQTSLFFGKRQSSFLNRAFAKGIDTVVLMLLFAVMSRLSQTLAVICILFFLVTLDAFSQGRSIGKKILGLQVKNDLTGLPCSFSESVLRNLPMLFLGGAFLFPALALFFSILFLPLVLLEIYLVFHLESGIRWGDVLAGTVVVEADEGNLPLHDA